VVRKRGRPTLAGKSQKLIAEAAGTNVTYLRQAQHIMDEAPDLSEKIHRGELTIPAAMRELKGRQKSATASRPVDERMAELRQAFESAAARIASVADSLPSDPWFEESAARIREQLHAAARAIRVAQPGDVCPYCFGDRCDECKQTGHIPKWICGQA
jgi:hypothetical protein